jgi:cytochrome c biogenesis protein CcmG/thiol:disulfide interchange protein DsbE
MKGRPMRTLGTLGALAAATLALAACKRSGDAEATPAPPFALRDMGGKEFSLQGLRGKVVAVNFWATWCAPCRQEIPDLVRVYAAKHDQCFELLGVAEESGSAENVVATARKLGINYPVLNDVDGAMADAFRVRAYPWTFLLDAQGRIRGVFEGPVEKGDFERALAPLLSEAPSSCPRA